MDSIDEDIDSNASFSGSNKERYHQNQSKQAINDYDYVEEDEPNDSYLTFSTETTTSTKVGPKKRSKKTSYSKVTKRPKMRDDDVGEGTKLSKMIILGLKCSQNECEMMFDSLKQLNQHQEYIHDILPYPCLVDGCSEQFPNSHQIRSHYSTVHPRHSNWTCAQCNVKKTSLPKLRRHIQEFHQFGRFHCARSVCTFEAEYRVKVQNHHLCAHPHCICPIDGCGKAFGTKYKLQRHLRIHTKSANSKVMQRPLLELKCSQSDATLGTLTERKKHQKTVHSVNLTKALYTSTHRDLVKSQADPKNRSKMATQNPLTLKESTNSRIIILELKCTRSECDMKFRTWDQLYQHQESVHGALRYPCLANGCSEQFNSRQKVGHHIRIFHSNHTKWTCPQCNVVCVSPTKLRNHLKIHDKFGLFRCSQVGCVFEANNLIRMKNHFQTTHFRFICSIDGCGKVSRSKISLERHQQSAHFALFM